MVHLESAREIAAWWQALDNDFTAFASTGTIRDDLALDIRAELSSPLNRAWDDDDRERNLDALRALEAYLKACKVTVWSVGQNIAGYLPQSDIFRTLDYADALDEYRRVLTEDAPECVAWTDECECESDDSELCELCATEALVAGYLRDDVPDSANVRYGHPAAEEHGLVISAESWAGSMSYWLRRVEMTYGEFLQERES
ncbi:hypothetical protein [Pilimelia terevasa]|uniref:hypothetical protein n=1 Tax=Pilimelia terevasa TaxID=53372 RepID=UPI00166D985C|nr:hypothetical protein [Pilimelia terevasa]